MSELALLVTSRELLRVRGEVEYEVLPLADPDAVELFTRRAQLEPAADGRGALPPPGQHAARARARRRAHEGAHAGADPRRLGKRLDLFKGGRDAEARQATLRATIEWSHDLLSPEEQELFARLAVFAGGCTLEAAETVADADLDTLQSLVEKSLLRHTDERFWMLETIREYAVERLEERGTPERCGGVRGILPRVGRVREPRRRGLYAGRPERRELVLPERPISARRSTGRPNKIRAGPRLAIALEQFWVTNDPDKPCGDSPSARQRGRPADLLRSARSGSSAERRTLVAAGARHRERGGAGVLPRRRGPAGGR